MPYSPLLNIYEGNPSTFGTQVLTDFTLVGAGNVNGANSIVLSAFSTLSVNRLVLVYSDESQDTATVSSVTATGLTFSKVASVNKGTSQGNVEVWGAWAAAKQTGVVVTVNYAGGVFPQAAARTVCYYNTDQTGTVAAAIGATGSNGANVISSITQSITTTRANSLVVAAIGADSATGITAGSNQFNDGSTASAGSFSEISTQRQSAITASASTSVTMNATFGATIAAGIIALEILAPASAPPPTGGINFITYRPPWRS